MIKLDSKISKHANDIIQKYTSGLFKDASLELYGIKSAKIKELINVELPIVEVAETRTDFIFLLEDDSYLHIEFQSDYDQNDLLRFAMYDMRIYGRDRRKVNTVVIYTANVNEAATGLNIGSVDYNIQCVLMNQYDGDAIFKELEKKINSNEPLTDIDMLNLIFLPLMRNSIPRAELAKKSIELAQTIDDKEKKNTCIAAVFAFASKYLNENETDKLLEVLSMTDLAYKLVEKAVEKAVDEAELKKALEIAKNLLNMKTPVDTIVTATGLPAEKIKLLKAELNKE